MAAYQGYGYNKIARVLTARKIITPTAYQAQQTGREYHKNPYEWNLTTVYKMMENQAYRGDLVSGKRKKLSFKSKKIIKQSEEQWIIVRDIFPALISEQLWDDAHKALGSRKRESQSGFVNIFAGLLKCDRCGYALGIANASSRSNYFVCNTYKKKGVERCSSHYILYEDLYDAVLRDIRQVLAAVNIDRDAFVKKIMSKFDNADNGEGRRIEAEIASLEARSGELEHKFDRLYDDRLDGLLSDRKFKELSAKCEAEQDAVAERLEVLRKQLDGQELTERGAEQFVEIAEKYSDVDTLDKEMLNRLLDSIVVGDRMQTANGVEQKITVNYKFVGAV